MFKMLIKFFTSYQHPVSLKKISGNKKIALNYLRTTFPYDFLAILPLQIIHMKNHRNSILYILKLVRLFECYGNLKAQ